MTVDRAACPLATGEGEPARRPRARRGRICVVVSAALFGRSWALITQQVAAMEAITKGGALKAVVAAEAEAATRRRKQMKEAAERREREEKLMAEEVRPALADLDTLPKLQGALDDIAAFLDQSWPMLSTKVVKGAPASVPDGTDGTLAAHQVAAVQHNAASVLQRCTIRKLGGRALTAAFLLTDGGGNSVDSHDTKAPQPESTNSQVHSLRAIRETLSVSQEVPAHDCIIGRIKALCVYCTACFLVKSPILMMNWNIKRSSTTLHYWKHLMMRWMDSKRCQSQPGCEVATDVLTFNI